MQRYKGRRQKSSQRDTKLWSKPKSQSKHQDMKTTQYIGLNKTRRGSHKLKIEKNNNRYIEDKTYWTGNRIGL